MDRIAMASARSWRSLFWRFITHRPWLAVLVHVTVVISAAAEIAFPGLLQHGVNAVTGESAAFSLGTVALGMVGVTALIVLFHAASLLLETWLFSAAAFELRQLMYSRFQNMPLGDLARRRTGTLTYRATGDVAAFQAGVTELASALLFDLLVGIGVTVCMVFIDWRLTLLVGAVMVVATVLSERFARPLPLFRRATQMLSARLAGMLQASLGAARAVRAFGAESREIERLDVVNRKMLRTERYTGARRAVITPLWHFAEALGIVAVLWYGGQLVLSGSITIGALVGFVAYMELLAGPITHAGAYYEQFQSCRGLAQRIAGLLADTSVETQSGSRLGVDAGIVVSGLGFRYSGSERWALRDVSFALADGECTALVGRNGSGKSTLCDLLLRFYPPVEGRIIAGGVDLREWDVGAWRALIGYMPQETTLFHGSLADNVAYAKPEADRVAILHALEQAGAAPLLARLPHGLDTLVGERGSGLSGGERQLIGLARLFLRNPRIVLLDEPTAALDGEAMRTVGAALRLLRQGRTMVLISHIPETLALVERVVLLDGGRLVATGTPEELAATQPLYRSLIGEENAEPAVAEVAR